MKGRGFSLIEVIAGLVVVGLITAVGVRVAPELMSRNSTKEAGTSLQRAAVAQIAHAERYGQYTDSEASFPSLATGRGLTLTAENSTGPNLVSAHLGSDGSIALAALSSDGSCVGLIVSDPLSGGVVSEVPASTQSPCTAESMRPSSQ
jgi:prepilin-type N-terminal cleavage/methylation domain-containing protein